jgi:acetyltransferase-like isoleucine patch superfamily enzyme
VGAGSVVTKPVADYAIVAGNPAKPIGDRRQRRVASEC